MVRATHPGEFCRWHVTIDAPVAPLPVSVPGMLGRLVHDRRMTGQTGAVELFLTEPKAATGSVTMQAIQFSR